MKKVIVSLVLLMLLASCGKDGDQTGTGSTDTNSGTVVEEDVVDAPSTSNGNVCDKYMAYMECTYKKSGLDDATIKTSMDQTKSAFDKLPADQQGSVCQQSIDMIKQNPQAQVVGCRL